MSLEELSEIPRPRGGEANFEAFAAGELGRRSFSSAYPPLAHELPDAEEAAESTLRHSFVPYVSPDDSGKLRITTGYVNTLEVEGADDLEEFDIVSGHEVFWVRVEVDEDGVAISAEVQHGGDVPDNTEEYGYQPIFEVNDGNVPSAQFVRSSLSHAMCNGQHQFGGL